MLLSKPFWWGLLLYVVGVRGHVGSIKRTTAAQAVQPGGCATHAATLGLETPVDDREGCAAHPEEIFATQCGGVRIREVQGRLVRVHARLAHFLGRRPISHLTVLPQAYVPPDGAANRNIVTHS